MAPVEAKFSISSYKRIAENNPINAVLIAKQSALGDIKKMDATQPFFGRTVVVTSTTAKLNKSIALDFFRSLKQKYGKSIADRVVENVPAFVKSLKQGEPLTINTVRAMLEEAADLYKLKE